ncbi:MAG: radical SAM protein [Candidatus Omnitrophota bacterium]|nr:radical SAM protein [Candidatus Omnitrophota bacterium]
MSISLIARYIKVIASYGLGRPLYAPDSVSIIVSDRCNLRCAMCDFWKDSAVTGGISLDEFERLFRDLRSYGVKTVQLTGGEPFLRAELIDILKIARKAGLNTAIVTNGTLITESNVSEFARNIDVVYVSLDSPDQQQHEAIRGVPGIFARILNSLDLLVRVVNKDSLKVRINLVSTITAGSLHDPAQMSALAKRIGINSLIYNPASNVYYGKTTLRASSDRQNMPWPAYDEMINKIIALMREPSSVIRSNPFYLQASKEFMHNNECFYKFACLGGGYNGPLVGFDGTLYPCCAWNMPLGNVKGRSFSRIWRSPEARQVRMKIKKGKCPVCYHHTRTFDYLWRAPLLFKDPGKLFEGYKMIGRMKQ